MMKKMTTILAVACSLFLVFATVAISAQPFSQEMGKEKGKPGHMEMQKGMEKPTSEMGKAHEQRKGAEFGKTEKHSKATPAKVSEFIGMTVTNEKGEDLGRVRNLLIGEDGSVAFVIVSYGGLLGVGDREIPVPWREVLPSTAGKGFIISFTKEQFDKAPKLNVDQVVDLKQAGWREKLSRFYADVKSGKMSEEWGKAAGEGKVPAEKKSTLPATPGMKPEPQKSGTGPATMPESKEKGKSPAPGTAK